MHVGQDDVKAASQMFSTSSHEAWRFQFRLVGQTAIASTSLLEVCDNVEDMSVIIRDVDFLKKLSEASSSLSGNGVSSFKFQEIQYPPDLSREKHPVAEAFFALAPVVTARVSSMGEADADITAVSRVDLKVFANGAVSASCNVKTPETEGWMPVDQAVLKLRVQRERVASLLERALTSFAQVWNAEFPRAQIRSVASNRKILLEKYEFLDIDIKEVGGEPNFSRLVESSDVEGLREIVGFMRMSQPYARKTFALKFLLDFLSNDISNRENELWLVFRERFVRFYPERDRPEASHLNQLIPVIVEYLLATKAVYRHQVSSLAKRILEDSPSNRAYDAPQSKVRTASELRRALAAEAIKLGRIQYPSDLSYFAGTEHAFKLIRALEVALELDRLSDVMVREQDRIASLIDAMSENRNHSENMSLQMRLMWITIFAAILSSLLSIAQVMP